MARQAHAAEFTVPLRGRRSAAGERKSGGAPPEGAGPGGSGARLDMTRWQAGSDDAMEGNSNKQKAEQGAAELKNENLDDKAS